MIKSAIAAVALIMAAPSVAQGSDVQVRPGMMLRDAKNIHLGTVDRVLKDGSVRLISNGRLVTIPAATIVVSDRGAMTTLTRTEIAKLK